MASNEDLIAADDKHRRQESQLITKLTSNDILMGRGASLAYYQGNVKFRALIHTRKTDYTTAKFQRAKHEIAIQLYAEIGRRLGRFLRRVPLADAVAQGVPAGTAVWCTVSQNEALEKIKQALRETNDCNAPPPGTSSFLAQSTSEPLQALPQTYNPTLSSMTTTCPSPLAQTLGSLRDTTPAPYGFAHELTQLHHPQQQQQQQFMHQRYLLDLALQRQQASTQTFVHHPTSTPLMTGMYDALALSAIQIHPSTQFSGHGIMNGSLHVPLTQQLNQLLDQRARSVLQCYHGYTSPTPCLHQLQRVIHPNLNTTLTVDRTNPVPMVARPLHNSTLNGYTAHPSPPVGTTRAVGTGATELITADSANVTPAASPPLATTRAPTPGPLVSPPRLAMRSAAPIDSADEVAALAAIMSARAAAWTPRTHSTNTATTEYWRDPRIAALFGVAVPQPHSEETIDDKPRRHKRARL